MKKTRFVSIMLVLAVMLFGGIISVTAASSIPDSVVSDSLRQVEYIKNYPVIIKTTDNGAHYVYCLNQSKTYAANITFKKTGTVDKGFAFIMNNKPNTGDKDKDFYITQMAVWYYEDYINGNDFNLVKEVKEYIVSNIETDQVARYIYNLYSAAKKYKEATGSITLSKDNITFTKDGDYYVSSEITVTKTNLTGKVKYTLTNTPAGSLVVKAGENSVKVKIPVSKIPEGKQLTFKLNVESSYTKSTAYYYYHSDAYQKVLYQDTVDESVAVSDSVEMTIKNYKDYHDVLISKTDVTQSNEVPGATLVIKDADGKELASWVSTTEPQKVTLKTGEYSLTETIAPEGYKLSTTTIYFMVDANDSVYVKNESGKYVSVDKVVMINELKDVISVAKKDSKTGAYVEGAVLVIKDANGNVVSEFTTGSSVYQLSLDAGVYTLSEKTAPTGYLLSNEVISFELLSDGTLKVKNSNGEYVDSAIITFYNTKETTEEVPVPKTDKNSFMLIIGGIALLIGGIACAKKTIKEC